MILTALNVLKNDHALTGISYPLRCVGASSSEPASSPVRRAVVGSRELTDRTDWTDRTDLTNILLPGQPYTHTDSANLRTTPRRFLRLKVESSAP